MTARQPPGEKGAKACTIGDHLSRDGIFCAYFSGETKKKEKNMEKYPRYEVQTKYGWFSLDEASYRDYQAGKLWITWPPEQVVVKNEREEAPRNISKKALTLRDEANAEGIYATMEAHFGRIPVEPPDLPRLADLSIDELSLSVRASNGLMRAGVSTFGKLAAAMNQENGLFAIRNLGMKSEREIRMAYVEECYLRMLPYEKAVYWQSVLDKCGEHRQNAPNGIY